MRLHPVLALALPCLALGGCSSTESASAGRDASTALPPDGSLVPDAPVEGAPADATPPPNHCQDSASPPTSSYSLSDWPQYNPVTATDLTATAQVTTVSTPGAPAGVLVTKDGNWVLTAVAGAPGELAALRRQGTMLTLDHAIAVASGETPFGLAQSDDGSTLAMSLSDAVALFDTSAVESNGAGALLATVPNHAAGRVTIDVAFSRDGHFVFAALEYDRSVAVIDVVNRAYVGAIPLTCNAVTSVAVSPDNSRLYVVCELSDEFAHANPNPAVDQIIGNLFVIDVATAETQPATSVLGRVFVGRAPVRVIVSPDGTTAWVTARGSNAVLALDTASLLSGPCPLLASTPVGPAPVGLTFVDGAKGVAVANSNRFAQPTANQTVTILDAAQAVAGGAGAATGQVTVGAFPREVDADGTGLFVTNYNSRTISGIDLTLLPQP